VALKVVLDMSQFSRQVAHMMVIHKRDRPDGFLVLIPFLPDQIIPDQIPQRLRAIRILALRDVQIEIIEQVMVQRHTESNKLFHAELLLRVTNM
jgi:EAL domain-containing protein (putative c-di-GMP-specific phosphodiesterase class I)